MISIIVADNHAIVRRGLREILDERTGMVVRGEAQSGAEVLSELEKNTYDVLLLDTNMPDADGLALLPKVRKTWPAMAVLMLSSTFEPELALRAVRSGAAGYVTKSTSPEELVSAIHLVRRGRRYVSQELADCMARELERNNTPLPHEQLSERELEVMRKLAGGQSIKEIAYELSLSDKTVSTYRARLLEKMGMRSSAELIRYAIEQKIC
jgi:two-component system, NarL family, invasion response regulator UvrY